MRTVRWRSFPRSGKIFLRATLRWGCFFPLSLSLSVAAPSLLALSFTRCPRKIYATKQKIATERGPNRPSESEWETATHRCTWRLGSANLERQVAREMTPSCCCCCFSFCWRGLSGSEVLVLSANGSRAQFRMRESYRKPALRRNDAH